MYTHAPLNCWGDSKGHNKLTSSAGINEKDNDLSSLAIRTSAISSPSHKKFSPSASFMFNRDTVHKNQESVEIKKIFQRLKTDKLNMINMNNLNAPQLEILTDSDSNQSQNPNLPQLEDRDTTDAVADFSDDGNVENNLVSPEEKLAECEDNDDEKQSKTKKPMEIISDLDTPIPDDAAFDLTDTDSDNDDDDEGFEFLETATNANKPTLSLTEQSLRKHNKRKSSREPRSENQKDFVRKFGALKFHHHQQTLSEPLLPKFDLMLFSCSEDEKSGSSDGGKSDGMDNHCKDLEHTQLLKEDDVQLMPFDRVSRRSSINLTSGLFDYITPQTEEYNNNLRIVGGKNASPNIPNYKTRHEYLRDINYFNTWQRSQQFKKLKANKVVQNGGNNDDHKESEECLEIIEEKNVAKKDDNDEKEKEDLLKIDIDSGHRKVLSCDTQAAIEDGIEPYQPLIETSEESSNTPPIALVKQQSAMV